MNFKLSVIATMTASLIVAAPFAYAMQSNSALDSTVKNSSALKMSEGRSQFELWEAAYKRYGSDPDHNLKSKQEALRALKRSAELEYPDGLYWLALQMDWSEVHSRNANHDPVRFQLLKRAAELGHLDAHVVLGIAYSEGKGVEKDLGMYAYHQCIAARAGDRSAIKNLEFSMSRESSPGFKQAFLKSPVSFHARPDFKAGGITFLREGQEVWEVARYNNGWTAVYIHGVYSLGFVPTADFVKAL